MMKYYHAVDRTHAEIERPNDILELGDIISFGFKRFTTRSSFVEYHNAQTDDFKIPDDITLRATDDGEDNFVTYPGGWFNDGKERNVNTSIHIPIESTFMTSGFKPVKRGYNGGTMEMIIWTAMLQNVDYDRFVEFHFHDGWTTKIGGIFVHDSNDTFNDKLILMSKIETAQMNHCKSVDEMYGHVSNYRPMFPDHNSYFV